MLLKAVIFFLAAMGVLAIFGKKKVTRRKPPAKRVETARKCPKCGAFRIGTGDCACGKS
ncbi:hypothetical protein [Vannielia litorea]|uniref:Uncharacterized protein n=1 Tax=Vannielia litorea TaxID=1217970 RepID=A0A1N6HE08_9RHOB|nr:hypothetical protein [Vannielia litorea]SIO17947.1 hypothetical protein SAMN05444002_3292 [Vannielia litorea]